MADRSRFLVLGFAGLVAYGFAPGPVEGAVSGATAGVSRWWRESIVQRIDDAGSSMVIPDDAPGRVTVVCRKRYADETGYSFEASRGEKVSCDNGASPHWTP